MTKQENIEELNSLLRLGTLTGLSPKTLEAIKEATIAYEEQEIIIDKIRSEITECAIPDFEYHGCGGSQKIVELEDVLEIINKYKEEKDNG